MVSIRATAAALLVLAVSSSVLPVPAAAEPFPATTLSGTVRDDVGRVLEGAEVLVLASEGRSGAALLRAVSDAGGRFIVGEITPGVYRVAAIKSGYVADLGRVNTLIRSSIDLVLRPVPKAGEPGVERVLDDLSWTLRAPPRSVLRKLDAPEVIASAATDGARAFAARVRDAVQGEVDHVVALGSWRPGSSGPSSSLEGNETTMRLGGAIGERGAIQVRGRRGSLDSTARRSSPGTVSRAASDLNLDLSYDTNVDESLAMRAFYSSGDLEVTDRPGGALGDVRQSQRSWGYDASWRKQVDASSRVALQVGFHDASLDPGRGADLEWDAAQADASSRAIGAEGSYENLVGDGHLVRVGVRAQRLSLSTPGARLGRAGGAFALDGATGWSLLVDSEDRWSLSSPVAITYGLAITETFDGTQRATASPRIGGSWTAGRLEAKAELSYLATSHAAESAEFARAARSAALGYDVELKTRLEPALTLRGSAAYLPSRATVSGGREAPEGVETLYVSDGFVSDRFVALDLERVATSATVSFRLARGRVEGALAPALDDAPVVLLSDRALDYDAARLGVTIPRAGSSVQLEYRSTQDHTTADGIGATNALKTVALDFSQDIVRFANGRASCRFLLTARGAIGPGAASVAADAAEATDARRLVADHQRIGAGVALAF
jgi:hypothetical protein